MDVVGDLGSSVPVSNQAAVLTYTLLESPTGLTHIAPITLRARNAINKPYFSQILRLSGSESSVEGLLWLKS